MKNTTVEQYWYTMGRRENTENESHASYLLDVANAYLLLLDIEIR